MPRHAARATISSYGGFPLLELMCGAEIVGITAGQGVEMRAALAWLGCVSVACLAFAVGCGQSFSSGSGGAAGAGTGGSGNTGLHGGDNGGTGGTQNTGAQGGTGGNGTGAQGGTGGGILPTGDCNGPEDCGGHPCLEITPGGWRSCTFTPPEATTCSEPPLDECCNSAECAYGKCLPAPVVPSCGGAQPLVYNVCATDQCQDDSPCSSAGYDGVCLPAPMLGRDVRACMPVDCRVNADCTVEPGGYCAPVEDPCCGDAAGLFCVYPSNGCRTSAACPNGYCQPAAEGAHCEPGVPMCPG